MPEFLRTLRDAGVALLVDVRAVANSRRPGFSKNSLAANLETMGIGYRHLRALGTPAEGRAAARAGKHAEMHTIFRDHLALAEARSALDELAVLAKTEGPVCLLCFEADPRHPIAAVQSEYSLWTRDPEERVLPACRVGQSGRGPRRRGGTTHPSGHRAPAACPHPPATGS